MKKFLSFFAAMAFASAMVCGFSACKSNSDDDDDDEGSNKSELVGDWMWVKVCDVDENECEEAYGETIVFSFKEGGRCSIGSDDDNTTGKWTLSGKKLTIKYDHDSKTPKFTVVKVNEEKLILKGQLVEDGPEMMLYFRKQ